jgi:hypothetical protein
MSILNNPYCGQSAGNTGLPTCPEDFGFVTGGALVPASFIIEEADMVSPATLKAKLQAATLLSAGAGRIYPLPMFEEVTDQSTDPTEETLGFGTILTIKEGKMIHTWRFVQGGMWLNKKLRQFNNQNYKIIYFTSEKVIMTDGSTTGSKAGVGFSVSQFYCNKVKLNDGTKANQYTFKVSESNPSEWDNYAIFNCAVGTGAFNPQSSILGLLDINLSESVPATTSLFTIAALTAADQQDIITLYGTEFEAAGASAWIVKDSTGALVTVDTVALSTLGDAVELGFSSPLSAGTYTVQLASPADLATLNIGGPPVSGYESDILTITV